MQDDLTSEQDETRSRAASHAAKLSKLVGFARQASRNDSDDALVQELETVKVRTIGEGKNSKLEKTNVKGSTL